MTDIKIPEGQSGKAIISGNPEEQHSLHIPVGSFIDASNLVYNTRGENKETLDPNVSKGNFTNDTIRFEVPNNEQYTVKLYQENTARGETILGNFSGLPERDNPVTHIILFDASDKVVSGVKLDKLPAQNLVGGNNDLSDAIQIQTPDGKISGITNPQFVMHEKSGNMGYYQVTPNEVKQVDNAINAGAAGITPETLKQASAVSKPLETSQLGDSNPTIPTAQDHTINSATALQIR